MVCVNNSLSCKLNPSNNSFQWLCCCRPNHGVLVIWCSSKKGSNCCLRHMQTNRGQTSLRSRNSTLLLSLGSFSFSFKPLTHPLIFSFGICQVCTSLQILLLHPCDFSHLSYEAAANEDFPFVRTCTYWSEQVERSEDVIYTFSSQLWKRKENWIILNQQSWNCTIKRILLHCIFAANPAWGRL